MNVDSSGVARPNGTRGVIPKLTNLPESQGEALGVIVTGEIEAVVDHFATLGRQAAVLLDVNPTTAGTAVVVALDFRVIGYADVVEQPSGDPATLGKLLLQGAETSRTTLDLRDGDPVRVVQRFEVRHRPVVGRGATAPRVVLVLVVLAALATLVHAALVGLIAVAIPTGARLAVMPAALFGVRLVLVVCSTPRTSERLRLLFLDLYEVELFDFRHLRCLPSVGVDR
jgi:hypothetical protein